ncbi:MAG TPA: Ig-like domain-containing protein [Acidimicrobiia bacterium]|nr:Ig-like domain-containing protein [Acidimicrobiia bacterium]
MSPVTVRLRPVLVLQVALVLLFTVVVTVVPRTAQAAYPGANGWITFERGFDIWVVPADGSAAPTNLTAGGLWLHADPAFSPDGTQLAYAWTFGGSSNVWVADFDPSGPSISSPQQVTNGGADGEPSWSPDGSQIVFERLDPPREITSGTATEADPTGTLLTDSDATFLADGVTGGMIVENTTEGWTGRTSSPTGATTVPTTPNATGSWSDGDGYTISTQDIALWTATIGASPVLGSRLSAALLDYNDRNPVWSPTGTQVAFETTRNGNTDIYTITTPGGVLANLTDDATTVFDDHTYRPAWSPDGARIAFHSNEVNGTHANIWVVDSTDGSNPVNVTQAYTGTDDDRDAAFSPDGTRIVFNRQALAATSRSLSTVNADGSGGLSAVTLPTGTTLDNEPNWQPVLAGVDDAYVVDEGGTLVVGASGVLANDALFTTAIGTPTAVKVSDPVHGSVTVNPDGSFTYVHDGSESVSDSFTYRPVQNGVQGSVAVVSITVDPVNDAPVAVDDGPFAVGVAGGSFTLPVPGVLGNDSDPEGDPLTAVKVSDPSHGTVTLNANGSFTYIHDGSGSTSDSFTYRAKDGSGALSNVATVSLTIGVPPVGPSVVHSTGLVDPSQGLWRLYDDAGGLEASFFFGNPGDYPIFGDWDGDGVETPGMYRQSDGFVYLRNSNTQGAGEIRFFFGNPGDVPIAGDFNGDGFDTVSIYRPSIQTFFIINELGANEGGLGAAEFSYVFGDPGDKPFVGDFDGDGVETVGLHRESTGLVYFRNSHSQGNADAQFIFGDPDDRLIAGDWNGDGAYSPALFRPANTTMYFRFTNTQGNADLQFVPVPAGSTWLPIAGRIK